MKGKRWYYKLMKNVAVEIHMGAAFLKKKLKY